MDSGGAGYGGHSFSAGTPYVVFGVTGSSAGLWLNGAASTSMGVAGGFNEPTSLWFPNVPGRGRLVEYDFAELIVLEGVVSTADRRTIGDYLGTQRGITAS